MTKPGPKAVKRGKPIQLYPPYELRIKLEAEAEKQDRSLNNLIIVLLGKHFRVQDDHANAQRQEG